MQPFMNGWMVRNRNTHHLVTHKTLIKKKWNGCWQLNEEKLKIFPRNVVRKMKWRENVQFLKEMKWQWWPPVNIQTQSNSMDELWSEYYYYWSVQLLHRHIKWNCIQMEIGSRGSLCIYEKHKLRVRMRMRMRVRDRNGIKWNEMKWYLEETLKYNTKTSTKVRKMENRKWHEAMNANCNTEMVITIAMAKIVKRIQWHRKQFLNTKSMELSDESEATTAATTTKQNMNKWRTKLKKKKRLKAFLRLFHLKNSIQFLCLSSIFALLILLFLLFSPLVSSYPDWNIAL